MKSSQVGKNMIMNIISFVILMAINLVMTPLIVNNIGVEANSFATMANDFTSYFNVIAVVINAVAARFIAIAYHQKDKQTANEYYSSLYFSNIVISIVFIAIGSLAVIFLDNIIQIPSTLVSDVKITFFVAIVAYTIFTFNNNYTVSNYVKNRLDLSAIVNMISYIVRFAFVMLLFKLFTAKVYFSAVPMLIANIVLIVLCFVIARKILPDLRFKKSDVKKNKIWELVKSGAWMSFTSMSNVLIRGVEQYLANIWINPYYAGILSIARVVPNAMASLISTVGVQYTPSFVNLYAKGENEKLRLLVDKAVVLTSYIALIPVTGFMVFGYEFYQLWQKSLTAEELNAVYIISLVTVVQSYFNAATFPMAQLSVVVNKLKVPVLVSFGVGVLNVLIIFVMYLTGTLNVFTMVIPSAILLTLRYVVFNPIYAASNINCSVGKMYRSFGRALLPVVFVAGAMFLAKSVFTITSWGQLLLACAFAGVLSLVVVGAFFVLMKKQWKQLV